MPAGNPGAGQRAAAYYELQGMDASARRQRTDTAAEAAQRNAVVARLRAWERIFASSGKTPAQHGQEIMQSIRQASDTVMANQGRMNVTEPPLTQRRRSYPEQYSAGEEIPVFSFPRQGGKQTLSNLFNPQPQVESDPE